jgi:hypothetical protein
MEVRQMRFGNVVFALLVGAGVATISLGFAEARTDAQAPAAAPKPAPARAQGGAKTDGMQVHANLAQLMRGVFLPNSNVFFFAQSNNPADVKPAADPSLSLDPLSSTYGGWTAVENSSLALVEAANLLTLPGRVCSNGRAVPLQNPDWAKFVQGLRDAGMAAYAAAQTKNQDKVLDAADGLSTACQNCHDRYREKPGGVKDRCM